MHWQSQWHPKWLWRLLHSRPWYDAGMAEQPSRRRRIVKRSALAVAGVALLLSSYIASWGAWEWLKGRETIGGPPVSSVKWVEKLFVPIVFYAYSDWPGHRTLRVFCELCNSRGGGSHCTWSQADKIVPP
jgi:hypothetical protein